jgi:hypothetical protein
MIAAICVNFRLYRLLGFSGKYCKEEQLEYWVVEVPVLPRKDDDQGSFLVDSLLSATGRVISANLCDDGIYR